MQTDSHNEDLYHCRHNSHVALECMTLVVFKFVLSAVLKISVIGRRKCVFEHQDLQMFVITLINCNFVLPVRRIGL